MPVPATDLLSFGEMLQSFRKRRHLSQQQLADAIGVHRQAVGRWERGDGLPATKGMVLELARHLALDESEARHLLEASLTALSPFWSVPLPRNPFFTGREALLEAVHAQLGVEHIGEHLPSIALQGLGGIGKTQIALEYAYRHALEYSAVCWISAETSEQIVSSLLRIAEVLALPGHDDREHQRVVASVQRWLTTHGQWLVIWDNAEDLNLLDCFLPSARSGALLLTTRCQTLGTLAQGLDLMPMEQEEGIVFLLRRAKILDQPVSGEQVRQFAARMPAHYAAAAELVTTLGGLPLALDQAGAYLEETQCGLLAYLELFRRKGGTLLQQRGAWTRDHPASVTATFRLAMAATVGRHPAIGDLLRYCALLGADAIPEEVFVQGASHLGGSLAIACSDDLKWNRLVGVACSSSLLQRQPETRTLSMHRLVQAILQEEMNEQERTEAQQHLIHALHALFPEVNYANWQQCERLLSHVLLVADALPEQAEEQELAELLQHVADYLSQRAQYKHAQLLYERALRILGRTLGPEHSQMATLLNRLAASLDEQGEGKQAEPLYQRALQIREQAFGAEHPLVADVSHGLAYLYYKQGKYEQAESWYQRALQIREQAFGAEHPQIADSCYGLAYLYSRQGKYEQAESWYQRALQIREQVLEPTHPDLGTSLNGLAILYQEQGKYAQAEILFRRVLKIWEQRLGPEHPQVAAPLYSLGLISRQRGRFEQAERLFQRALQVWEQTLGPSHPNVASPLNELAELYVDQGKYDQAEPLGKRALQIWEQAFGPAHPNVGYPLDTLATLYQRQGRFEQAERLFQRALQIWEQAFGPEHPALAISLNKLANLFAQQGKAEQAEPLYLRALQIREQQRGQCHPETAETLYDLAIFKQQQGHLRAAASLAERALQIRTQSLGDMHPQTVASRTLSAQLAAASETIQEGAAFARRTEGLSAHVSTARLRKEASSTLQETRDHVPPEQDPLQAFLDACCELHPLAWCRIRDLWDTYECWTATEQRCVPLPRRTFAAQLKARGCRVDRTSTARIWCGIRLVKTRP